MSLFIPDNRTSVLCFKNVWFTWLLHLLSNVNEYTYSSVIHKPEDEGSAGLLHAAEDGSFICAGVLY